MKNILETFNRDMITEYESGSVTKTVNQLITDMLETHSKQIHGLQNQINKQQEQITLLKEYIIADNKESDVFADLG